MDWTVNASFLIDIIVTLFSVIEVNGKIIDDFPTISKSYIKGWFFIDLITIFPWDLLFDSSSITMVAKLPRVLKFVRITWIFKLNQKMIQNDQNVRFKNLLGIDK